MSILLNENAQNADGTFKYRPTSKLERGRKLITKLELFLNENKLNYHIMIKGVQQPGVIRVFDPNGEVVVQSCFTRLKYQPADFEGGIGFDEVGNRGTKHGLNRYNHFETIFSK